MGEIIIIIIDWTSDILEWTLNEKKGASLGVTGENTQLVGGEYF